MEFPSDPFQAALAWARDMVDDQLQAQLNYVHNMFQVLRALATAQLEMVSCKLCSGGKMSERKITTQQVRILQDVRAHVEVFSTYGL